MSLQTGPGGLSVVVPVWLCLATIWFAPSQPASVVLYLDKVQGHQGKKDIKQIRILVDSRKFFDGRVAGHVGAVDGSKTSSILVCICPHFGM